MQLALTEEQQMIQQLARDFARSEIAPAAEHYDKSHEYPWPIIEKAQELGLTAMNIPEDLRYTSDHEWVRVEESGVRIGITDYAQDQLGDIVFVELPEPGASFERDEEFGTLESVKAVSEIYLPVSGEIVAVNNELEDAPELLNEDPYQNWIVEVRPADIDQYDELLSRDDYLAMLKG